METIIQYKIENKKLNKESYKKSNENQIFSMTFLNDMIISGGYESNEIKIWKN